MTLNRTEMLSGDAVDRRPLGVLGGMGPLATADFFNKLVALTPARKDQDHIPTIINSAVQIPDRTAAILEGGESPLPAMLNAIARLERAGAERIAIPCNTAHFWFDDLQARTSLQIIHIVDAVAAQLAAQGIAEGKIGVLGTTATLATNIYPRRLSPLGYVCEVPSSHRQDSIMSAIQAVKGKRRGVDLFAVAAGVVDLLEAGCEVVVLACTELPLALPDEFGSQVVDATKALAAACVRPAARSPALPI